MCQKLKKLFHLLLIQIGRKVLQKIYKKGTFLARSKSWAKLRIESNFHRSHPPRHCNCEGVWRVSIRNWLSPATLQDCNSFPLFTNNDLKPIWPKNRSLFESDQLKGEPCRRTSKILEKLTHLRQAKRGSKVAEPEAELAWWHPCHLGST